MNRKYSKYILGVIFALVFVASIFYSYKDKVFTKENTLNGISIPYSYYDGAYNEMGLYEESSYYSINISGRLIKKDTRASKETGKTLLTIACNKDKERYKFFKCIFSETRLVFSEKNDIGTLYSFLSGEDGKSSIILDTKDMLIVRVHFAQEAGGYEYRIDRKNSKVIRVVYAVVSGVESIVYPYPNEDSVFLEK